MQRAIPFAPPDIPLERTPVFRRFAALPALMLMGFGLAAAGQTLAQGPAPQPAVAPSAAATQAPPVGVVPRPRVVAVGPITATAEQGLAAVYSDKLHGRMTANGERYDRTKLTTAHPTLPFGTMLRVTHTKNGKSVVVRVNDRGPTQPGRIVDLSPRAAKAIGIGPRAMGDVSIQVVKLGNGARQPRATKADGKAKG
jgi:rare lipoprotein A